MVSDVFFLFFLNFISFQHSFIVIGKVSKNIFLQWGEMPTSVAYIGTGQIMGWGNKAIEIRGVETGHLDGVFMHKKAQKLKFLCERNDKVRNCIVIQ